MKESSGVKEVCESRGGRPGLPVSNTEIVSKTAEGCGKHFRCYAVGKTNSSSKTHTLFLSLSL